MDSCKCPITDEIFDDPVMGDDGHTYERKAITEWLVKNGTSPITRHPMDIHSLKTNYTVKKVIEELRSALQPQQAQYQFQLDVDIRKTGVRPLFQEFGKSIYEVEWINRNGPTIVLLKIDGAKANREASFYAQLSCHPHIVRTFGLVQCDPGSVMLLQECTAHGDLSELLRENGFRPTEQVLWKIFEQICDAMICLADNGIVHGDLACRNVLVFRLNSIEPKENLIKLTDFGMTCGSTIYSIVDSPTMSTMTIIPVRYAAPEILRNPDRSSYSEKSDVYSMGVLMWEACSYGQLPYSSLHNDSDVRHRKLNDMRLPQPSQCSDQLWTIINGCWQQESLNRPTFKILKELLSKVGTQSTHSQQQGPSLYVDQVSDRSLIHTPNDIVYIPCEYCNELIDLSHFLIHAGTCLEGDTNRLENRARMISQEPITELIPCEYCQQLCSVDELHPHETNCYQNLLNVAATTAQSHPSNSHSQANLKKKRATNRLSKRDRSTAEIDTGDVHLSEHGNSHTISGSILQTPYESNIHTNDLARQIYRSKPVSSPISSAESSPERSSSSHASILTTSNPSNQKRSLSPHDFIIKTSKRSNSQRSSSPDDFIITTSNRSNPKRSSSPNRFITPFSDRSS